MSNNEWREWEKNKLEQREREKWAFLFSKVDGNRKEWRKTYQEYLKSDIWKEKRKQVLKRANGKCERCKSIIFDPDVHHLTYIRVGAESLDDLIVVCFTCHRKADIERDDETEERRNDAYYEARLNGFALKEYGDGWWFDHEREEVEIKFIMYLYRLYCEEYDFDFDPHLDTETDIDFIDFWNNVRNGYG